MMRPVGPFNKKEGRRFHELLRDVVVSIKAPRWSQMDNPFRSREERLGYNASSGALTSSTMVIAAAAFVAACMLVASVAYFVLRYLPPGCLTPHFRKCDGMRWDQLGGRRRSQWYYIITNFGEHCLLWDPDKVSCFNKSQLHFGSKADCQEQCENETLDRWCGSHVSETMVDCRESGNADAAENAHWWFYDAYLGSCQNWSDVCIDYWFNSLEQCAYMCLP